MFPILISHFERDLSVVSVVQCLSLHLHIYWGVCVCAHALLSDVHFHLYHLK